ncbi:basic-leucine zipper transcription factor A-like [Mytilus trossulus]|uniref:basic-leucine zipper transcription factor A-like n=1 Tax=Mytilus trossulus TaxID=6551 RepID=UPI0030059910
MKPQYYDCTEDLDDYLSQFEILAELNAWNYVTRSLYLAGSLKGDARTLLSELSPMERKDYQSLLEAYRVADKQKTNRYRGHPINAVATNESACLDDPESFTKTFMDGFRQEMKSLTNDIKQVVKSAQGTQPGKTNDNYSNNKQWSNNYQNKGNYQNRNNNNGSGNNNRSNSYNGQNNNNDRNQNGRNDRNGNTAQNYEQGYSGNQDLSNTGAGVRQMSQGPG